MNFFEALLLGIIQGLSEFIPISSTAHLTLAGHYLGLIDPNQPEQWTAFIATIQLGTLAAVFVYFSGEIRSIPTAFIKENLLAKPKKFSLQTDNSKMGWLIILGSIPVAVVGLAAKDFIEGAFTKELTVIGISLIALALLLALAEKTASFKKQMHQISIKDSLLIGAAQCLALIPGASRSGTTITAGLFLGLKRDTAAKFSFLMSIPAIFGSGIFEFLHSLDYIDAQQIFTLIIATIASAVSGYIAIAFLIKFLKSHSTFIFVGYRIALGVLILALVWFNI